MSGLQVFRDEVALGDNARLDRAVMALGAAFDPTCDVAGELEALDAIAESFDGETAADLLQWMRSSGFRGNELDYYNPDNSMLHRVLRSGLGIPITLSVVAIEIGRRRGVPLVGIGAPGEFLVRSANADETLLSPFRGVVVDEADVVASLNADRLPRGVAPSDLLNVAGPTAIVERMLNNLEQIYLRRSAPLGLATVYRLRLALPGATTQTRRRYASVLEETGDVGRALEQIRAVITGRDPHDDLLAVRRDWLLLRRIEAHLN